MTVVNDATNPTTALDLSWNAVTGATSYNVLQASTLGGTFTQIASGVNTNSYTVSGLTAGTEYAFEVQAVNGNGTSPASGGIAWATEPAAPTGITASSMTATSITISFTAPSIGSTNVIDQYNFRFESPVGSGIWTSGIAFSSPFTIIGGLTSLSPLTQYGIEISTAISPNNADWSHLGALQGPYSSELTVVTPAYGQQANVIRAGPKNPVSGKQRKVIQPILSRSIETGVPPGVPTPNYTGYVILASKRGSGPEFEIASSTRPR